MPRNYIRKKPERAPVTEEQISRAKELIDRGKSKRAAASTIGISESCLRKRLKLNTVAVSMGQFKPTFNSEQESEFVLHCKQMDDRYFGLTINDLRRLAYEYANINKIDDRFDKSCKMAGRDWVESFLKRHPQLVLRQSAATSLARAMGFNKFQVDRFYANLKELYEKYKFKPNRIYNVDETGINTVPKKTPKVVTTKGKKVVAKLVSAERGVTVTAICCMSASGNYIPPALIYPRKRPRDDLLDGGPTQSICMVSDSGFVNTELFLNWLQHFKYYSHPSPEDPVLLLLDNHSSHISLEAVTYARENNIVMLTLPPHGSHKLQPLDRCLYSPLKVKYAIECDKFMSQNPERGITQYHVARLFNEAYKKVATLGNAESGFKVTGIYPYDDDLFDETDFAPSLVTDQIIRNEDIEHREATDQLLASNQSLTNQHPSEENQNRSREKEDQLVAVNQLMDITNRQNEGTRNVPVEIDHRASPSILDNSTIEETYQYMDASSTISFPDICNENVPYLDNHPFIEKPFLESQFSVAIGTSSNSCPKNTSSNMQGSEMVDTRYVPVAELSPLPRMKGKRNTRGKVSLKSEVITSSPYKDQLEEKQREAGRKKRFQNLPPKLALNAEPSSSLKKSIVSNKTPKTSHFKRRTRPSAASTSKIVEYFCPLCKEKYTEPPTEEWIQCKYCTDWWHEECTSYERGIFVCDNCTDDS